MCFANYNLFRNMMCVCSYIFYSEKLIYVLRAILLSDPYVLFNNYLICYIFVFFLLLLLRLRSCLLYTYMCATLKLIHKTNKPNHNYKKTSPTNQTINTSPNTLAFIHWYICGNQPHIYTHTRTQTHIYLAGDSG